MVEVPVEVSTPALPDSKNPVFSVTPNVDLDTKELDPFAGVHSQNPMEEDGENHSNVDPEMI